ncbi:MAG: AAA family ATPase, partial [Anaerolineales bacterium]|nr:AAA family ATPase [Anaerolineales bacterium]
MSWLPIWMMGMQRRTRMQTHEAQLTGFRLQRLEVLNWGTFHGRVWCIEPSGSPALLTGANGSGKSTLVDALLTLLVPSRGRNYNQASGASGKRERSEESYVRGAYGKVQQEGDYRAKEQYLREKDSFSVLLAVFGNGQKQITVAQFFWFQNSLNKFFVLADSPLSIQEHFAPTGSVREFKKYLRGLDGVQVFDHFHQYSKRFRKQVSLRSDKAFDLFNQTVTIKEIGSLNSFVRQHMLETPPTREKIQGLIENFDNLTQAHEALEKARQQLNLLKPIVNLADRYEALETEIEQLEACEKAVPTYFAGHKHKLLVAQKEAAEWDKAREESKLTAVVEHLTQLRDRATKLEISISQDSVGQRLSDIKRELRFQQREREQRQDLARQYAILAQEFELPPEVDEATFHQSRQQAEGFQPKIEQVLTTRQKELEAWQIERNDLRQEQKKLNDELTSLRARPSQIPKQNLDLRTRILDALGIAERDVPFVGELLQVRDKEWHWAGAIERVLHNFGLRLLVPERHYERFATYVRQTNLRGRLVFHRIAEDFEPRPLPNLEPDALFNKLRLKPETLYRGWIENELVQSYNYLCCDDMRTFQRASRAITAEGLIKSGNQRHEKDDRHPINDPSRFILGWNNADKIRHLEAELEKVSRQLNKIAGNIQQAERQVENAYAKRERLQNFLAFGDFAPLDWRSVAAKIDQLTAEEAQLTASSDKLQQLRDQLAQVQGQIADETKHENQLRGDIGRLAYQIQTTTAEMARCEAELTDVDHEQMAQFVPEIKKLHGALTLDQIDAERRNVETHFRQTIRARQNSSQGLSNNLIGQMRSYKAQFPAETVDFDDSLAAIPAFRQAFERIQHDDLPQYESRFKNLLNEKVVYNVTILQGELDKYREEIEES